MNDQVPLLQMPKTDEIRITLLGVDSSVSLARELVRYALTNWGFGRSLIDDSVVVMSEIVTNAGAPRGVPSYPRYSREELKGGSWA
ncbi:hypothetical protein OHR68_10195 [Spirillospora sp. NBC_00431]